MHKNITWNFYIGMILNPKSDLRCDFYPEGMLVVKHSKKGAKIHELLSLKKGVKKYEKRMSPENTKSFGRSLILPSFFDMHFHWVQDEVRTAPKDSLLKWLDLYTFPAEAKFANTRYSKQKAKVFFKQLTEMGTLGGAIYSSIHENALDVAFSEVKGDFVIGNVLMDQNAPEVLLQSEAQAISVTKKMIKAYGKRFAFTPRFAITTSAPVMKAGSVLADQKKCFKQTHLSETPDEIDFTLKIYRKQKEFQKVKNYTELYQRVGMLGKRSLMGHGIHLSTSELKLIGKTKTILVHCPTSNAPVSELGLGSGLFDFKKVEKNKVRWALGSDIGGGPFLSMFDVMHSFVKQNRESKSATYVKALYRATLAGAQALGIDKRNGNLNPKKSANFLVVPLSQVENGEDVETILKGMMQKLNQDRSQSAEWVSHVFYQGIKVFERRMKRKIGVA